MNPSNSIEKKLNELIPSSMSEHSLDKIDAIIDNLSHDGFSSPDSSGHGNRQKEASVSWSDIRQWKIAAVFGILVVLTMALASKFNLVEFSSSSDRATAGYGSATLDIEPLEPRMVSAVVSPTPAQPGDQQPAAQSHAVVSASAHEGDFTRVSESLTITDESGTATLEYREGQPWLRVESVKGVQIYNNYINEEQLDLVPSIWRDRVVILEKSLEESSKLRRSYRARYIPKSKEVFVDAEKLGP